MDEAFRGRGPRLFLDAIFGAKKKRFCARWAGRKTAACSPTFASRLRWHKVAGRAGAGRLRPGQRNLAARLDANPRYLFSRECSACRWRAHLLDGNPSAGRAVDHEYGKPPKQQARYCRLDRVGGDNRVSQGLLRARLGPDHLASLKTRALRDVRGYYCIRHQRNQEESGTTGAHRSPITCSAWCDRRPRAKPQDWQFLRADRFDEDKRPGLSVAPIGRPLRADHEGQPGVFDNVRNAGRANRPSAPENAGWTVAQYLLEFEPAANAYTPPLASAIDDQR